VVEVCAGTYIYLCFFFFGKVIVLPRVLVDACASTYFELLSVNDLVCTLNCVHSCERSETLLIVLLRSALFSQMCMYIHIILYVHIFIFVCIYIGLCTYISLFTIKSLIVILRL
jgi:hypothetical protein